MSTWKKAGPNGEIEITVKGQRWKIEKALDHNERHKGEWKIMMWDKRRQEWSWDNTVRGKAYAKELVMDKLQESTTTGSVVGAGDNPTGTVVVDKRRRKDKQPKLLKRFRRFIDSDA